MRSVSAPAHLFALAFAFTLIGCDAQPPDDEQTEIQATRTSRDWYRRRRRALPARVMSFNLRWGGFNDGANNWVYRRDVAYQVLRDFRPDSVGTQEPTPEQIADVEAANRTLDSYEFKNDPFYTRTQQILYRNDRFARIEANGFLLVDGLNEDGTIRYCTWVRLRDRYTRRSYYHYNVHLDGRVATRNQTSAVNLMKHIAARATSDPFVITGDFNAREPSPTLRFLRGEQTLPDEQGNPYTNPIPLVDTYRVLYPDAPHSGTASGFRGHQDGYKIDFVLIEAGAARIDAAEIMHTNVDGQYPSDHFPVTTVIEWP